MVELRWKRTIKDTGPKPDIKFSELVLQYRNQITSFGSDISGGICEVTTAWSEWKNVPIEDEA